VVRQYLLRLRAEQRQFLWRRAGSIAAHGPTLSGRSPTR
jgi:hypothetical protein